MCAATDAPATNAPAPAADAPALEARQKEVQLELYKTIRSLREQRNRYVVTDEELRAMSHEITELQQAMETLLHKKYPAVQELEARRDALLDEYEEIQDALRERREEAPGKADLNPPTQEGK